MASRETPSSLGQFEAVSAPLAQSAERRSAWRHKKKVKADGPPNLRELRWLAEASHRGHYSTIPENWLCPWCNRTKFQVIRPSKQYAWSFSVGECWIVLENGTREKVVTCRDCYDTRTQIAREAGVEVQDVRAEDVLFAIEPKPHSQHFIKSDRAVDIVIQRLVERASWGE